MKTITQEQFLLERIISLQMQQTAELQNLKIQFHNSLQSLNPLSIFKSSLIQIDTVPEIKNVLLKGAVNLTSHLLAKNTLFGILQQPINKLVGTILNNIANKFTSK